MSKKAWALVAALCVPAIALAAAPDTILSRQAGYKAIGKANKAINEELKQDQPSIAVLRSNSAVLLKSARRVVGQFPRGTGPEAGVKTAALPVIWQKPQDFKIASGKLIIAAEGLQKAAASGDVGKVRAAMAAVGPTCKGCHEQFRGRD